MPVFFPGGEPAADVALRFVQIQDPAHLSGKSRGYRSKSFGHVLVDRGFGDPEPRCRGADGGLVLNDVFSQRRGAPGGFDHDENPSHVSSVYYMKGEAGI